MRIIVAGAGEVGSYLVKMLSSEEHEIVIIDNDEERLKNLAATCDLMTMCGSVTSREFLIETGVSETDLFIAVTSFDDTNIVSAIMAKKLGAKLTVVRIGKSEMLNRETRDIFTVLGIDSIVYPEKIAAHKVADTLRKSEQKNENIVRVMIIGGSHIGRMIAKELGKDYSIKIFEADSEKAYYLSDNLNNVLVIHGDGTKSDFLLEEGLQTTDVFIAVTGNSETNILTCLLAKNEGVKHAVADIENIDYINIAERLGIDTILNKKLIVADFIHRFTIGKMDI